MKKANGFRDVVLDCVVLFGVLAYGGCKKEKESACGEACLLAAIIKDAQEKFR